MIDPAKQGLPMNPAIQPSAYPLLTTAMEARLRGYLEVVERYVQQHSVPVTRVEISGFEDPEEGDRQLVVALWMSLPAREAMERWDGVGRALEDWVSGLNDLDAGTVAEGIALEVYSNVDDAAAA